MIVVDACVVIALLNPDDSHHEAAAQIVLGDRDLVLHPVTLAEVLIGPARMGDADGAFAVLSELGFRVEFPSTSQPGRLARLRVDSGLRLPDCYVLDTAEALHAALATFDTRLARVARARGAEVVDAEVVDAVQLEIRAQ